MNAVDDMIKVKDLDLCKILMCEKQCQNVFIYRVTYETSNGEKDLRISFDKVCGYIEKDSKNYLSLMPIDEKYEQIFEKI